VCTIASGGLILKLRLIEVEFRFLMSAQSLGVSYSVFSFCLTFNCVYTFLILLLMSSSQNLVGYFLIFIGNVLSSTIASQLSWQL
jgi:hypothetical protein